MKAPSQRLTLSVHENERDALFLAHLDLGIKILPVTLRSSSSLMPVAKPQGHQVEGHCSDPSERRSLGQRGQVVQRDRGGGTGLFPIAGMGCHFLRSGVEEKNQLRGGGMRLVLNILGLSHPREGVMWATETRM